MARKQRFINIKFPFQESRDGFLLDLTRDSKSALRSDLMHLLFASKGKRLYYPDFGTNFRRFLFEPMDDVTYGELRSNINTVVANYFPNVKITKMDVEPNEDNHTVRVKVEYTATDGVFDQSDFFEVVL